MLVLTDVSKSYNGIAGVSGFSYVLAPGNGKNGGIDVLFGPSGGGKSTLLRMIAGLEKPDSGSIDVDGAAFGMVFQEDRLCDSFGAVKNVELALPPVDAKNMRDQILSALSAVGIDEPMVKPVGSFSGGMKRRVAVVRACLSDADVLLMDEPFAGVDDDAKQRVIDFILKERRGRLLIVVTHDMEDVKTLGAEMVKIGNRD
jgi:NitT/TauT family transport system ATP-binding protein